MRLAIARDFLRSIASFYVYPLDMVGRGTQRFCQNAWELVKHQPKLLYLQFTNVKCNNFVVSM